MVAYESAIRTAQVVRSGREPGDVLGLTLSWLVVVAALVLCIGAQVFDLVPEQAGIPVVELTPSWQDYGMDYDLSRVSAQ
ncbi:hypothetical protein GCM10009583_31130 [Ornithinicoccus hortensis]|uniref:Uncharacterized protein n=1 Tax=Ornithinicoccus hortensis TaxID=82346 RepID=A0A542YLQ1_9MICO|nr:hypothetical protein FB467_0081 [Ornithinicoccus hortensis]